MLKKAIKKTLVNIRKETLINIHKKFFFKTQNAEGTLISGMIKTSSKF